MSTDHNDSCRKVRTVSTSDFILIVLFIFLSVSGILWVQKFYLHR